MILTQDRVMTHTHICIIISTPLSLEYWKGFPFSYEISRLLDDFFMYTLPLYPESIPGIQKLLQASSVTKK